MAAPSILDVADKELVLRVRGPSRQGQIVRLRSKKCTIGSGSRCTLRLRARGVRPLHCLVLQGGGGTVIRCFAPDTRVNGRAFTDAELMPGDQLSVGPLEFEVLESEASSQVRLARTQEDLSERERLLSQRDAELNQRAEQIDRARSDLEAERRGFEDQRSAWDADRAASESQASGESAEREARKAELDARQAALDTRQSELDSWQADLDARESEIDQSRRQMEIDDRSVEGGAWSEPEGPDQEQDVRFDEPSQGSPESSEEIFVRMGLAPSLKEDEAGEPPPSPWGPTERDRCESVSPPAEPGEDQDESIDDYMARLLHRVRETTGQPNPPMPPRSPEETAIDEPPRAAPVEEPDGLAHSAPPPTATATAREAAEPSPRATAPEKSVDMAAVRELANFSARAAINHHARRALFGSIAGRLIVALVGLIAAAILTWIWWTDPANTTALCAAAVNFVVVLLWGVEYTVLRSYAVLRQAGPGEWNDKAEKHADEDPHPERDAEESP